MIPSRDTAHLVQDPTGNWMVVGTPKPAQGVQPPPLNAPLPEDVPPPPPAPPAPRVVDPREVTVHMPSRPTLVPNAEVPAPAAALATPTIPGAPDVPAAPAVAPDPALAPVPVPAPAAAPVDALPPTLPGPPPAEVPVAAVPGPPA
jgi:hypothetical protein